MISPLGGMSSEDYKTMKRKAMEHLAASCSRDECLQAIGIFYDKIEYFDTISQMLPSLGRN